MMRTILAAWMAFLFVGGLAQVVSAQKAEPKPEPTKAMMRMKLEHAQGILEGLAIEDFSKISKGAQAMILLSHESNWKVLQTPEYVEHSEDFRRIANDLVKHSRQKNLDAAALDYVLLTANCIQCHKYVRDANAPAK